MRITHFVNSFVNRPGNIGIRTGHILKQLNGLGTCVCRGAHNQISGIEYREMGVLGHIPRILNGVRVKFAPNFDHRIWDIALYERFAQMQLSTVSTSIAHVWDICPRLIESLKDRGIPVVLDMPMVPAYYGQELYQNAGIDFLRGSSRIQSLERRAIELADLIISPSEFVASVLRQMGVDSARISVIEFGVHWPSQTVPSNHLAIREKKGIDYCFFGNINRRKGIPELMEAWSDPVFKDDRLHLCGRINSDVRKSLSKTSIGALITPGFVFPFDYMMNCDVFILPSWMEGSAKSVYEAMACGLPSIVTHSTGSIVRDGVDGFVIDAGDINALKDRMHWFKRNPDMIREMGSAARERAQKYTWERYARRVVDQYRLIQSAI